MDKQANEEKKTESKAMIRYTKEQIIAIRKQHLADSQTRRSEEEAKKIVKKRGITTIVKLTKTPVMNVPKKERKVVREPTCNMWVSFGSFKNVPGEGHYADPNGKWCLIPLELGKNPQGAEISKLPISKERIGCNVCHVLIRRGDTRIVFTSNTAVTNMSPMSIVYLHSLYPTLSMGAPYEKKSEQTGEPFTMTTPSNPRKRKRDDGWYMGLATPTTGSSQKPQLAIASTAHDESSAQSVTTTTTTTTGKKSIYGNVPSASKYYIPDIEEIARMIETTDCSAFSNVIEPPESVKTAYIDGDKETLTREQCIMYEFMFPHLIVRKDDVVQMDKVKDPILPVPKLSFNAGNVTGTHPTKYVDQDRNDYIQMLRNNPCETVLDESVLCDREEPTFLVASLEENEREARVERRMTGDVLTHPEIPVVSIFEYKTDIDMSTSPPKNPLECFSKFTQFSACLPFSATTTSWPESMSFMEANEKHELYNATLIGRAFDKEIGRAFLITCLKSWSAIAPKLVPKTSIWYEMSVNHNMTARHPSNAGKDVYRMGSNGTFLVNVHDVIADLGTALRNPEVARKMTPKEVVDAVADASKKLGDCNLKIERIVVPDEESIRKLESEIPNLPSVTCITEKPTYFEKAVAAKCDFYGITGGTQKLTYVYAVRQDISQEIVGGGVSMMLFENGGIYDGDGMPVINARVYQMVKDRDLGKPQTTAVSQVADEPATTTTTTTTTITTSSNVVAMDDDVDHVQQHPPTIIHDSIDDSRVKKTDDDDESTQGHGSFPVAASAPPAKASRGSGHRRVVSPARVEPKDRPASPRRKTTSRKNT